MSLRLIFTTRYVYQTTNWLEIIYNIHSSTFVIAGGYTPARIYNREQTQAKQYCTSLDSSDATTNLR